MNLIFFCQSIDENDPIVSDTKSRVLNLASQFEINKLMIITSRGNDYIDHPKITTVKLQVNKNGRLLGLFKFYYSIIMFFNRNPTVIYFYMTPTIAIWASPFKLLKNVRIAIWFAHTQFTPFVRFNLKFICNLWFAPNKAHAKLDYPNLRIVGQAVDINLFAPVFKKNFQEKKYDLITVGRITPIKNYDLMIEIVNILKIKFHYRATLAICGDAYSECDRDYKNDLIKKISEKKLDKQIYFLGLVDKKRLPLELCNSRIFLFPQPGGLSKSVVESLASGIPVLVSEHAEEYWGDELDKRFYCDPDIESYCKNILKILSLDNESYYRLSSICREMVLRQGDQNMLFKKITSELLKLF